MALSHSPRSDCEEEQRSGQQRRSVWRSVHSNCWESYWDVLGQPLGDVQVVDLQGDLLAVARFGHSDGRQVLQTKHLINAAETTCRSNSTLQHQQESVFTSGVILLMVGTS